MNPGDLVALCAGTKDSLFLHSARTLESVISYNTSLKIGQIALVLELDLCYQIQDTDEIEAWIPVVKILTPAGIGWVQTNCLEVVVYSSYV